MDLRRRSLKLAAAVVLSSLVVALVATAPVPPDGRHSSAWAAVENADQFLIVDCLLPGKIKQLGTQVTFVNSDSKNHQMNSDPHPEHTDCPELNQVGNLEPGQSRQSGNLNVARRCGFHDHLNDGNNALKGAITIQ